MFKNDCYTSIGKTFEQASYIAKKNLKRKNAIVLKANKQISTAYETREKEAILEELLSNSLSDSVVLDAEGNNALMKLLKEESSDFILFLLDGLSKNFRLTPYLLFENKKQDTLLISAAKQGCTEVCEKILRFMNENIDDFSGKLLGEKSYENQCYLAFLAASAFGHHEVVELFLSKRNLELLLTDKYSGDTALTIACRENHTRVATLLYEHGADPKEENKIGESPYLLACAHRNVDLIVLFADYRELTREEVREVVSNVVNKSKNGVSSNDSLLKLGNNFLKKIDSAIVLWKHLRKKADHSDEQVCFESLSFERYCQYLANKKVNAVNFEAYIKEFPQYAKNFYNPKRSKISESRCELMYNAFKRIQKAMAYLAENFDHLVDPMKQSFYLLWGDELLESLKEELEKISNFDSILEVYKQFLFSDDYKPRLLLQIKNIAEQLSELEKVSSSNASSEVADNDNLFFQNTSKKRVRLECAPVVSK